MSGHGEQKFTDFENRKVSHLLSGKICPRQEIISGQHSHETANAFGLHERDLEVEGLLGQGPRSGHE